MGLPSNWTFSGNRTLTESDEDEGLADKTAGPHGVLDGAVEADATPDETYLLPGVDRRGSVASLKAAEISRSRSSSVEMMDNLDEIERALQELSPRSLKLSQRTPIVSIVPASSFASSLSFSLMNDLVRPPCPTSVRCSATLASSTGA
jgi:hypothetical protein